MQSFRDVFLFVMLYFVGMFLIVGLLCATMDEHLLIDLFIGALSFGMLCIFL